MDKILKMIRISLKLSRIIINRFYNNLTKIINKLHYWMMQDPKNSAPLKGINLILMGINGIIFSAFTMPIALDDLMGISWAGIKPIPTIIVVAIGILAKCLLDIWETIIERKLEMPIKYKFLVLSLSIPLLFLINKFLKSLLKIMASKTISVVSSIIVMFITIFLASYAISFLVQKSTTCDKEHLNFCTTENLCKEINLYWWDNSCHTNEKPELTCSKDYIHLCDTENLCKEINLYWWDNSCHTNEKPELTCSKDYIHLCDTENLCKEINLYWWDNSCHTNEKPEPEPSEYPDYNLLEDLNSLVIIENEISWSPEGNKDKIIAYKKQLESTGQFAKIYLYAEASINGKPLTQYESLYILFNDKGGHLFRPQSLKIPSDTITRLLYAVNNIPYLKSIPYSESRIATTTDWFKFFKDDSSIVLDAFISSLTPAKINKIIIYYDCVVGSNCEIKIK